MGGLNCIISPVCSHVCVADKLGITVMAKILFVVSSTQCANSESLSSSPLGMCDTGRLPEGWDCTGRFLSLDCSCRLAGNMLDTVILASNAYFWRLLQ